MFSACRLSSYDVPTDRNVVLQPLRAGREDYLDSCKFPRPPREDDTSNDLGSGYPTHASTSHSNVPPGAFSIFSVLAAPAKGTGGGTLISDSNLRRPQVSEEEERARQSCPGHAATTPAWFGLMLSCSTCSVFWYTSGGDEGGEAVGLVHDGRSHQHVIYCVKMFQVYR